MPHSLPDLPFGVGDLAPYVDARTMEFHHGKHHQAYVTKLNEALAKAPAFAEKPLLELMSDLDAVPESIRTAVRNVGGGTINHSMFWLVMQKNGGGEPSGALADAITKTFGGFQQFVDQFSNAAAGVFGSGWAWLVADAANALSITTTPNQDTPLSHGLKTVLLLDVWEHAYYLQYQNKRPDYIDAWWHVVNWGQAEANFAGHSPLEQAA